MSDKTFKEMFNAIGDSKSDLVRSEVEEDGEDAEDVDEDPELGKQSEDDKAGWVMATISKMEQHHMESFWHKQMRLAKLMQLGWRNLADQFWEREI